jgi:hypothetical protein
MNLNATVVVDFDLRSPRHGLVVDKSDRMDAHLHLSRHDLWLVDVDEDGGVDVQVQVDVKVKVEVSSGSAQ